MNRGVDFQSHPIPASGEGLEAESITNGQRINQLCLCNKASIKIHEGWGPENFQNGEPDGSQMPPGQKAL